VNKPSLGIGQAGKIEEEAMKNRKDSLKKGKPKSKNL